VRGPGKPGRELTAETQDRRRGCEPIVAAGSGSPWRSSAPSWEGRLSQQREPLPTSVEGLPDLPPDYESTLRPVARALDELGAGVEDAAWLAIRDHVRLLLAWNHAINLTAVGDPVAIARVHVADSLAAVPWLREHAPSSILDIGSGGGFPGLPIAVTGPAAMTLVESVGKKARFLEVVVAALGLAPRVTARASRSEDLVPGQWDVVTARAVGDLSELVELALPLLSPGGHLLAWKRGEIRDELQRAGRAAREIGGSPPAWMPYPEALAAAGLTGHGLVVVQKVRATAAAFPRDPAARRRRPW
jgi:16S rRNA (guanine527-N7)-methyltransferase